MKNKIIALCCAALLFSFSFVPLRAEASDNILRIVQGYTQSSIKYAYDELNNNQKDICDYLIGCYNLTYLGARGFVFEPGEVTDFNSFQVTVKRLGSRIIQATGLNDWGTRMSDVFCQYVSSCIQYAQQQTSNFSNWYTNLPADFSIPYGKDNYDAWNNFYNDLSNDGIATFQTTVSNWDSGNYYDFAFVGKSWLSGASSYNNFILNNSPVCYTNEYIVNNNSNPYAFPKNCQIVFPIYDNGKYINSIYILNNTYYSQYRFGYDDGSLPSSSTKTHGWINYYGSQGLDYGTTFFSLRNGIQSKTTGTLQELIEQAFNNTPFIVSLSGRDYFQQSPTRYYPYIEHIYLVDDLSTLSNKVEIFNVTGTDISSNDTLAVIPKEDMLFYIKQLETDLPFPYPSTDSVPIKNIVINNTYNYYGDQADPDTDFETAVVDRSAQSFSEPYSVDEGIFTQASEYITYLWENTKPLVLYTKDLLECLTITPIESDDEKQEGSTGLALAIYGSLAVGVAGGLISKLLL